MPVYFPTAGLVSVVITTSDGAAVECAAVGREGWIAGEMFGGALPAGALAFQQIAGSALRMTPEAFHTAAHDVPAFAACVTRFPGLLLSYALQTAACNRLHEALGRCARWLLFTYERVGHEELAITHEFLAQMLGASRTGVTTTMAKLESMGLVHHARAQVVLRDVEGLRRIACECYGVLFRSYERYLASLHCD